MSSDQQQGLRGNLINVCVLEPLNESIKVMWMHPAQRRGESPPIPQIEISQELGERLDSFWITAKAKLIGHHSLLCVKSHLSASGL